MKRVSVWGVTSVTLLMLAGIHGVVVGQNGSGLLQQAGRLICTGCGGDANPPSVSADGRFQLSGGQRFAYEASDGLFVRDISEGTVTQIVADPSFSPVLSPDGKQIAYHTNPVATFGASRQGTELRVVANQVGATPRVLHRSQEFMVIPAAWAPDGKSILAVLVIRDKGYALGWVSASDGRVQVIKFLADTDLRGMGRFGCCHDGMPSLSPDGKSIAYAAAPLNVLHEGRYRADGDAFHIYVLSADNSVPEVELVTGGVNRSPVWTPDGKHLLFVSDRGRSVGLWSAAVTDGALTPIRADMGEILSVGVSNSGSYFYTRNVIKRGGRTFALQRSGEPGSSGAFRGDFPRWSPDGTSFAFVGSEGRSSAALQVYWPTTKEERRYVPGGTLNVALNPPQWFRDGKSVFVWIEEPVNGLRAPGAPGMKWPYRVNLATGAFTRIAEISIEDPEPVAISSDDKTAYIVVFRSVEEGRCSADTKIVAVDLRSGENREVASRVPNTGIVLSPDDRTLYMRTCGTGTGGRILSVDVATGKQRDLFVVKNGQSLAQTLAVSPDSRTVATIVNESAASTGKGPVSTRIQRLVRIEVDGTDYKELLMLMTPNVNINTVSWSRDGSEVLFEQRFINELALVRIPADGGVATALARANVVSGSLSPDASRFMVVRDAWTEQQLWALDNVSSLLKSAR